MQKQMQAAHGVWTYLSLARTCKSILADSCVLRIAARKARRHQCTAARWLATPLLRVRTTRAVRAACHNVSQRLAAIVVHRSEAERK